MQILMLHDGQEVRDRFVFFIESTYNAVVHEVSSVEAAREFLSRGNPPIDLVIVSEPESDLEELKDFVLEITEVPVLLSLDPDQEQEAKTWGGVFRLVDPRNLTENMVQAIDHLIDIGITKHQKSEEAQCRIRTRLLLAVCPLKGDVYIRLSADKYVKLFSEGDTFDYNDMEKYTVQKGVEYLYIRKEQCAEFAVKFRKELEKMLKSDRTTVEGSAKLGTSVHEVIQELMKNIGFTKEVQELVKAQVQLTLKSMGQEPSLAELMRKLQSMEGFYIATHSTICAYIACGLAAQLDWGSGPTFQKLTLAAFLHDITLENHDLAKIKTIRELDERKKEFSPKELKDYRDHPIKAAEMTRKMSEVPPDVDTIIRQHHERPDGTGFPGGLEHKYIAPLACVFIVAHDLTQYALDAGSDFNIEAFLQGVREQYSLSYFRKILACLEVLRKF